MVKLNREEQLWNHYKIGSEAIIVTYDDKDRIIFLDFKKLRKKSKDKMINTE